MELLLKSVSQITVYSNESTGVKKGKTIVHARVRAH